MNPTQLKPNDFDQLGSMFGQIQPNPTYIHPYILLVFPPFRSNILLGFFGQLC